MKKKLIAIRVLDAYSIVPGLSTFPIISTETWHMAHELILWPFGLSVARD